MPPFAYTELNSLTRKAVFVMRRRPNKRQGIGKLFIILGTTILLAMILPVRFWWFILGVTLISFGIWYNRCYK